MARQPIPISADMKVLTERCENNFVEIYGRSQNNGIPLDASLFFTDNTARDAAIPIPSEGQFCAVLIKNNEYYLEQYQVGAWVKVSIGNRIADIIYISGQSVNDANVGESMLSTGNIVTATNAEQYYKIGGVWDETPLNTGWVATTNNHLTANVSGRYLYIGRALVSVNKPCTITLALYKNGELFMSTDYGFANSSVFATIVNTDIMFVDKDNVFELYVKSSATLTDIEVKSIGIIFTEQKKH